MIPIARPWRSWRVLLACVLTAAGLGLWLHQRSATAECRLVPVGGKTNGCHCTQRIEP